MLLGDELKDVCRYRPKMQFTPDGLSPDGEHLLEILSTATVDTAEPANTTSTNAGAASNLFLFVHVLHLVVLAESQSPVHFAQEKKW